MSLVRTLRGAVNLTPCSIESLRPFVRRRCLGDRRTLGFEMPEGIIEGDGHLGGSLFLEAAPSSAGGVWTRILSVTSYFLC